MDSWPNTPYLSLFLFLLSLPCPSLHAPNLFHSADASELFHMTPWYSYPVSCLSSRVPHSSSLDLFLTGRPQLIRIISHCAPAPVFMLTDIVLIFSFHCFPVQLIPMLYPSTPSQAIIPIFLTALFLKQTLELLLSPQFLAFYIILSYSNSPPTLHSHHWSWYVWGAIVGVERQNSCSPKLHRKNIFFLLALPLNRQNREELYVNHQQGFAD